MALVYPSRHPIVLHKVAQLRSSATPPPEFRRLVKALAQLLVQEATSDLATTPSRVTTPLAETDGHTLADTIALVPILRAGLGMCDGVLDLLPEAQVWHLGLRRDETTLEPEEYVSKVPSKQNDVLALVLDPMLATGGSAVHACEVLRRAGVTRLKYLSLIAAPEGIERLGKAFPRIPIHVAAIDEKLNSVGFIHPGLGDAGDRQFATFHE